MELSVGKDDYSLQQACHPAALHQLPVPGAGGSIGLTQHAALEYGRYEQSGKQVELSHRAQQQQQPQQHANLLQPPPDVDGSNQPGSVGWHEQLPSQLQPCWEGSALPLGARPSKRMRDDQWLEQQKRQQRGALEFGEEEEEETVRDNPRGQELAGASHAPLGVAMAEEQTRLLQEPPVPVENVACDLPPAGPELASRPADALNPQALAVLAQHGAALYDQHLRLIRFDDALAELASCRGLLVRFHIKSVRAHCSQSELVVEAPECMTVEYLKRRVVKAKLQRGDKLLDTSSFLLRKRFYASSSETAGVSGGAVSGLEELPSSTPAGDEIFLFHLGYRSPGPYELYIATAPQTSDKEQQEELLSSLASQAQQHRREQHRAAAVAAAANMAAQPADVVDARLSYQALLEAPPAQSVQQRQRRSSGTIQSGSANAQHPLAMQGVRSPTAAASAAGAAADACTPGDGDDRQVQRSHRRQLGRWTAGEVAALIAGVQTYGTHWATIYDAYVRTGCINPGRTQTDLKDKWRNVVKLARNPHVQARSTDLTEEEWQTVQSIISSSDDS